jgi:hypothetical protein
MSSIGASPRGPLPGGVLHAKDAPYLLTILFAMLGWTFTHGIDRLLSAPTLEYECKTDTVGVACALENLSQDKVFRNLHFTIQVPRGSIANPQADWLQPCTGDRDDPQPSIANGGASYHFGTLHPGCGVKVLLETKGQGPSELRVTASAEAAVKMVQKSVLTRLVRSEFPILFGAVVGWSLLIVIYLLFLRRAP